MTRTNMENIKSPEFKSQQPDIAENGIKFSSVSVTLKNQQILYNITGSARVGEILAIMGPSGSGKTTLLNCIAGRLELLSGEITLNGATVDKYTRRNICYVLQEDVLFANLTMKETIYFAAMLKLPSSMSHKEKMARIDYIVDTLNLRHCLDTPVGNVTNRGLSGGEKKRVTIACELITNPDILILDEPTSGLDSYTALQLITQLKEYATKLQKVIITTIHQPSSQIFYSFNKLLLLAKGKSVYFGQANEVLDFFEDCGLQSDPHYNPADFILDKVNGSNEELQQILDATCSSTSNNKITGVVNQGFFYGDVNMAKNKNAGPLMEHHIGGRFRHLDPEFTVPECILSKEDNGVTEKWPTSVWSQYRYLTWRQFKVSKSLILSKFEIFEFLSISLLIGAIWFQTERTDETVRDIAGIMFLIISHLAIKPLLSGVVAFPLEAAVINKERASGMYRLSAYILSKFTSQLPLNVVLLCISLPIPYWMAGLNQNIGTFFAFLGVTVADFTLGQSVGFFIGAAIPRIDMALVVTTFYLIIALSLSGFYTHRIPSYLRWLRYFSMTYYPYHALLSLEFSNSQPIRCVAGKTSILEGCAQQWNNSSVNETLYIPSNAFLELEGVKAPLYCYLLSTVFLIILIRFLVYVAFVFVAKPK